MHIIILFLISFFVVKGIRLCGWRTKTFSIGGSNLTNVNYANIDDRVKFIYAMKFYQQSLEKLAEIVTESEKEKITYECRKFCKKHECFKNIFNELNEDDKNWNLDYLSSKKRVILYKNIKSYKILYLQPREEDFLKITPVLRIK